MTNDKLQKLVAEENEQLEREAAQCAKDLIGRIARNKRQIEGLKADTLDAQSELRSLQVQQLDPVSILGE